MEIAVIGTGFVGVVTSAVYSSFGHKVHGLDIDENKVAALKNSQVPFYEPDLEALLKEQQQKGTLSFTTDYSVAIPNADVIILAVGTPSKPDGSADLSAVFASSKSLAAHMKEDVVIAVKSTVPPGTFEEIEQIIKSASVVNFHLASLPEFLREGSAVQDTLNPDRIVIGATSSHAFGMLQELHKPLKAPVVKVSPRSAQMAKYTANAYLATRITFINQIADLCEKNHADIEEVITAIGYDERVGQHYWYPGFGYGGSCFPKDVKELAHYSESIGEGGNLLNKIHELNEQRIPKLLSQFSDEINGWEGKTVAILGLSFKPHTNDMREAPSTKVIPLLLEAGASVRGFDPRSLEDAPQFIASHPQLTYHKTIAAACEQADVILALIEWPEILTFDYSTVRHAKKHQWFIDARNQFRPQQVQDWGYVYFGIGR